MNKKIITVILVLLLVYLVFFTKSQIVEGLEPTDDPGFFSFFSNIFSFGGTGKGCLNAGESYIFNVGGQEIDIRGPAKKIFDNLSNDNCVITIDKLIEYGFPQPFLNQILPGQTEITVDDMNDKISEIKQKTIRSIEGMSNTETAPIPEKLPFFKEKLEPENQQTFNHSDQRAVMIGEWCFLYCCLALGRESISREQLTDNLSEWASTNYMVRMVYTVIPTKSIEGLFDVFSDKNEKIPSFNAFLTNKIRKSNVKDFLDNDLDTIMTIINAVGRNAPQVNLPDEKDIPKILNESVDRLFDDLGENNIIVMKDVVQKILEEREKQDPRIQEENRIREKQELQRQEEDIHRPADGLQQLTLDFLIMDRFGMTENDSQPHEIGEEEMNELLWIDYLLTKYLIETNHSIDDFDRVLNELKDEGDLNDVIRKITPEEGSYEWEYNRELFLASGSAVYAGPEIKNRGMGDDAGDFNNETFPENMIPEETQCIPIVPTDSIRESMIKYNECRCPEHIWNNDSEEKDYCMNEKNIIMEKFSGQDTNCLNKISTRPDDVQWCLFSCSMDDGMCDLDDPNCSESCESRNNLYTRVKTCIPNPVSLNQQPDHRFCSQFRTQSGCDNETTFDTNEGPICHWGGVEEIGNEDPEALNGTCIGNNDTHTVFYCNQFITKYECDSAESLHHEYGGEHLLCNWSLP